MCIYECTILIVQQLMSTLRVGTCRVLDNHVEIDYDVERVSHSEPSKPGVHCRVFLHHNQAESTQQDNDRAEHHESLSKPHLHHDLITNSPSEARTEQCAASRCNNEVPFTIQKQDRELKSIMLHTNGSD